MEERRADRHDAAVYASEDQLLAVAVPFVVDAVAAGTPVVVALPPEQSRLVLEALPAGLDGVTQVSHSELYQRPALSVLALQQLVAELGDGESAPVRVLAATPLPNPDRSWRPWARFESHLSTALAGTGVWLLCVLDGRQVTVLGDVPAATVERFAQGVSFDAGS